MKTSKNHTPQVVNEVEEDQHLFDQENLLKALTRTIHHFFGGWKTIFKDITDPRDPEKIEYSLAGLLCTGVLMFLFRLKARRQIKHKLRGNGPSAAKFKAWFGVGEIPHGDTLNYAFKDLEIDEVQEVVCRMVNQLIRKKVLDHWRFLGNFRIGIDGTGVLVFRERHCEHCLTKKLSNGEILYYHPVLEAKLITPNGFAISIMTEFIENPNPQVDKQDCELKAFYRLAKRLKDRFPHLPICLLLDGLYADGPVFQICDDYGWKFMIVLREDDLVNVHRSYKVVLPHVPENHKRVLRGENQEISQEYRWASDIEYEDSKGRIHELNVLECTESKPDKDGGRKDTKFMWVTNFTLSTRNVDTLANEGGRLRWKIENEGFNEQKNGGYELEHAYSKDENASKVFYYLLQIAHLIFQLLEKGSDFRKAFPNGVGGLQNLAFRLLEAWRNLRLSTTDFCNLYKGRYQIRFDTS